MKPSFPITHTDYALQNASRQFLETQLESGFNPIWMLTFHYNNPYQRGWRVIEPGLRWGYRLGRDRSLWNDVGADHAITNRRNDIIKVSADACVIRNHLIRAAWGVNDLRKHDQSRSPMLVFHERGREQLQYHTHMLLPALPSMVNSENGIHRIWSTAIRPKVRCLSQTNSLHVQKVYSPASTIDYLTKEVCTDFPVIDWNTSILFRSAPA
jgi:hypothetical protein